MSGRADDSSYSTCSEESSHAALSRETSDPLVHFALSIGYCEKDALAAVEALGKAAQQDTVLSYLVVHSAPTSCRLPRPPSPSPSLSPLRSIVIDGSNIAFSHGKRAVFSCGGIEECVNFFRARGHTDILVVLPAFRKQTPRSHAPILNHHVLLRLDEEGLVCWTPSRRLEGRRIACHDDRFILRCAIVKDGVIVSNDEFRDLWRESVEYREIVQKRLLMYSFVDGKFMPPEDPLGKSGPTLDDFLSRKPRPKLIPCPYGTRCTYKSKCKYDHSDVPAVQRIARREPLARTNSIDLSLKVGGGMARVKEHSTVERIRSAPLGAEKELFVPSASLWGQSELSVGPITPRHEERERQRISHHLSHLFPPVTVHSVMEELPHCVDARTLTAAILARLS